MSVEIGTENALFFKTTDIKFKFKADNLTGFSDLFRFNLCLLNSSMEESNFQDSISENKNLVDVNEIEEIQSRFTELGMQSLRYQDNFEWNPPPLVDDEQIEPEKQINLQEKSNFSLHQDEQKYFTQKPNNCLTLLWTKTQFDVVDSSLPDDFELEMEFETKRDDFGLKPKQWIEEWTKMDKLRLTVVSLLNSKQKDQLIGKQMLFGDPELTDVHCLTARDSL